MSAQNPEIVDALRAALKERDRLRKENARLLASSAGEPIAILGMACRYPGGVESPEELWRLLAEGGDAIASFPADRGWDLERLFDPDAGASHTRAGGFLRDPAGFDSGFFELGPREALATDPQQRLLLEVSWEALEAAGIDPNGLGESQTGVFAGIMHHDYGGGAAPPELEGYRGAGVSASIASGRIAYQLGLEGPAMTVDTACSSSLVAMHLAAQALRQGECSLALAGGSTVLGTPGVFVEFSRQGGLAPDGRSKSFAEAADGVGWSEGVGILVLERLSDAERNGHPVLATIRGSAVNQDGASNGLTAPNGPSQERVIRQALANAGLKPKDIDAVEAHGTGTTLGDPIEAGALFATYGQDREVPLRLGSIKSNIGHTQAAAGVAGVIKMVMAMREGVLPRTLHVDEPSSKVDWEGGQIELLTDEMPWEADGRPRRAGVSSFGISGTNGHVILEEAPAPTDGVGVSLEEPRDAAPSPDPIPMVLSAKSDRALRDQARRLVVHLREQPALDPIDVAYSLATTRSAFECRAVALGADREEFSAALSALADGAPHLAVVEGHAHGGRLAYLLSGQGSQRLGMGRELCVAQPAFAAAFARACEALDPHLQTPLDMVLFGEGDEAGERLGHTAYAQPALFAVEVALFELLRSQGLAPDLLAGHSIGEIAAAHVAGVLSLADAAELVCARGRLMGELPEGGAMVAIEATEQELGETLAGHEAELSIAAINGPRAVVLSGARAPLEELEAHWQEQGRKTKRLDVSHAFHSPLMEPMLEPFAKVAAALSYKEPHIPIVSGQSGRLLEPSTVTDPSYWVSQVREPVRFAEAIATLEAQGASAYLELGPDPVLVAMVSESLAQANRPPAIAPLLREGRPEVETVAAGVATAHVNGASPDWGTFFKGTGAKRVPLPTYPFQRKRYWIDPAQASDPTAIGQTAPEHPLLGASLSLAGADGEGLLLTGRLSLASHPWLAGHVVGGAVLFPGTAFLELAMRAAEGVECPTVRELTLQAPLILPGAAAVAVQVTVSTPDAQGSRQVEIHSRRQGEETAEWTLNAEGILSAEPAPVAGSELSWPPEGAEPLELEGLYERLAEAGFVYGPAFQNVQAAWRAGDELFAEVSLGVEETPGAERFGIHPALLDSAFHVALEASSSGGTGALPLPFAWRSVSLASRGASTLRIRTTVAEDGSSLQAFDRTGAPVLSVGSVMAREVDPERLAIGHRTPLHRVEWTPARGQGSANGSVRPPLAVLGGAELSGLEMDLHSDLTALLTAIDGGADAPAVVLADARSRGAEREGLLDAAHDLAWRNLELLQEWTAAEQLADSRLVLLTEGAVSAADGDSPELASAPIPGLVRSARSEHPGRFATVDVDGSEASVRALPGALAMTAEEPQLAVRQGEILVTRLAVAERRGDLARPLDPESTVLITGGTSGIGAMVARHLASVHGGRHFLLASRSGGRAEAAAQLEADLAELGAEVRIEACDVGDREQLQALIESIDPAHPLAVVVHSAGLLDDGTLESLDRERLLLTMRSKADAAWHLHELTGDLGLSEFLMFSSAAGLLGGAAQANYAAANAFLDALAARRNAEGLPGTAMAWGLWGQDSKATDQELDAVERERIQRQIRGRLGLVAMPPERALDLFDAARALGEPLSAPALFDASVLRKQAAAGTLPAVLAGLVRTPPRRAATSGDFADLLQRTAPEKRPALVLGRVREEVAAVLGHDSAEAIDPNRAFKELGFDSLAAVELRNRLGGATGLRLATTVVFDYPSAAALAEHLLAEASGTEARGAIGPAYGAREPDEPIAIVGMACRYPGDVVDPAGLWELVAAGRDAISPFPGDRGWDLERLYDPDPDRPGTSYSREGGFVRDPAGFDAEFFGIGPREALAIDPQQRLLLESCWEGLEDAGIDPGSLLGSGTGVFAGLMYQDYGVLTGSSPEVEGYMSTLGGGSVVSGRVAYHLGLEGPAITVDTACSSSLVALHLASQALRGGECSLALAGGVTVLATASVYREFSRQRGLAPDGRCKSFAEAADGTGFSEGVGVLVLERLSDAERNGHPVLATIRGSAVNQDGASNGLTAPNGPSQERVIRQALANARLTPQDIDAVEAHGTGTTLGDPIEAGALLATYGQDREEPLKLGSIKSNIGHTQAAAGVAGVIKMVMAMREGVLPRTLHVDEPSSKVDWEAGRIELLTEAAPWEPEGHPRRGGVSSFGASGTNAHLILEEAPQPQGDSAAEPGEGDDAGEAGKPSLLGPTPLPLSAKSEPALRSSAARLAAHMRERPELDPADLSYSLATSRALFEQRAVAFGEDRGQLLEALDALAQGATHPQLAKGRAKQGSLAYLFTGQGSQRPGMGAELHRAFPAYAEVFDRICGLFDRELANPLAQVLFCEPGSEEAVLLANTAYAQPALFATEVALHELLRSWGIRPDLLAGHSIGEIAAAHIAGVLSLPDAVKLVAARGRLMGELPQGGAMVAIEATEQELGETLAGHEAELSIAAINGPRAVVLSGARAPLEELEAHWQEQGRKTKRLDVSHAFHSPLMEPMLEPFAKVLEGLELKAPQLPVISNLSGELLSEEEATDPAYWVRHARGAVRFADAVASLDAEGATTYLELGPDPVLCAMASSCLEPEGEQGPATLPTLREGNPEPEALAATLAAAHVNGASPDWETYFKGTGAKRVPLPTYPFQRKRYWLSAEAGAGDLGAAGLRDAEHPLLGALLEDPSGEGITLTGRLSLQTHPWLADHAVAGTVLLPGTAFVELALRAGSEVGCETLEELTLQAPLLLPERGAVQIQVSVGEPADDGGREISIHSRPDGEAEEGAEWTCHAQGVLSARALAPVPPPATWPPEEAEPIELEYLYDRLAEAGFEYGPAFQGARAAWVAGEELFAEVSLAPEQAPEAERFAIHPALFDSTFHAAILTSLSQDTHDGPTLPFAWSQARVHARGATELRVRIGPAEGGEAGRSLALFDAQGSPVVEVGLLQAREVPASQLRGHGGGVRDLHAIEWTEIPWRDCDEDGSELELWHCDPEPGSTDTATAALALAERALRAVQEWLEDGRNAERRLVFVTRVATAVRAGECPEMASAPIWGLLRSIQSEHPGRFVLVDLDDDGASGEKISEAVAVAADEPQLALREGRLLVPRLRRADAPREGSPESIDPESTVLITGATGALGALVTRHLVATHGARHLLLVSRSGGRAKGAAELRSELEALGAEARFEACDVADRAQLEELLSSISAEHPLGAVIHAAGVVEDGLVESLGTERMRGVFSPKATAAWHLHELTSSLELDAFVSFSSVASTLGTPGQANYAAANAFLDSLAAFRRARGLAATTIAWGAWATESAMSEHLGDMDLARMKRLGIGLLSSEQGLALFDAALTGGSEWALAFRPDLQSLRADAPGVGVPPIMSVLVRKPRKRAADAVSFADRIARAPEEGRPGVALELVRAEVAAVLGHSSAAAVDPGRAFKELGFDSLAAVELRNRLGAATGQRLAATVVFDYPSSTALADHLLGELGQTVSATADAELDRLGLALAALSDGDPARSRYATQLRALAADLEGDRADGRVGDADRLRLASDEELLDFIDAQVGTGGTD